MNTNSLLTNNTFLVKNNIVIIKLISEFRIEKVKNLIIRHDYYLPKKSDNESFFQRKYLFFLCVYKHQQLFSLFLQHFLYVRTNNSLMFVAKGSRITPTPVMNDFEVYYLGFFQILIWVRNKSFILQLVDACKQFIFLKPFQIIQNNFGNIFTKIFSDILLMYLKNQVH